MLTWVLRRMRGSRQTETSPSDCEWQSDAWPPWLLRLLAAALPRWAEVTAIATSQGCPYGRETLLMKQHYNTSPLHHFINMVNSTKWAASEGENQGAINPTPFCQVRLQRVLNHTNREPREGRKCISGTAAEMTISWFSNASDDQAYQWAQRKRDTHAAAESRWRKCRSISCIFRRSIKDLGDLGIDQN